MTTLSPFLGCPQHGFAGARDYFNKGSSFFRLYTKLRSSSPLRGYSNPNYLSMAVLNNGLEQESGLPTVYPLCFQRSANEVRGPEDLKFPEEASLITNGACLTD